MSTSVLQKMLRPLPKAPDADPAIDGLAGVLGKAASVSALAALEVQLEAQSRAAKQCGPEGFVSALPENGLYFRIECQSEGQIGLLAIDPALIESLDNVVTGELDGSPPSPRPPTAIDAAIARPFLDSMLQEFAEILCELRGGEKTDTYQTAQQEMEPSPHMFPEIPYLQIDIDFDFLGGKGKGHLGLMLPAANTDFAIALPRKGESRAEWRKSFIKTIETAPASFEVVLYRKNMPIGQILKLKTGDMLEIPARALENLSVESRKGALSRCLMKARLGEYQEMRAAKITRIGDESPSGEPTPLLEAEVI
jgi:flagellar motor switch/type III secretory pathway protein FliN